MPRRWTSTANALGVCCLLSLAPRCVPAQSSGSGDLNFHGSLRGRVENWGWFDAPPADSSYTYEAAVLRLSLGQSWRRFAWQAEGAFPLFVQLPGNAVAPGAQGALGYGGDYFAGNGQENLATGVLKTALARVKSESGRFQLQVGRFEFADGAESVPDDAELAELKRDRVNQRLIATFNYALRSFDGAELSYHGGGSDVTVMGARLVEGSFQLRALSEIDVELAYGSYTRHFTSAKFRNEVRVFALGYRDGRGVLKSDNRPPAILAADRRPIQLATPGAHFISEAKTGPGTLDLVLWGAAQFGRWGTQSQLAGQIAPEAGYRFPGRLRPWIRAGYERSSGDGDPNDDRHGTFFPVLTTGRLYARLPFYILMNADDRFLQFKGRPGAKWTLRSELHSVRLSSAQDLWYDGGGAFQGGSFGYVGRPNGGQRKLGASLDLTAEYAVSRNLTVSTYAGAARGDAVAAFVFPAGGRRQWVHLASLEIQRRF